MQKHKGTYKEISAFWELIFPGGLVVVLSCDCLPNSWRSPKAVYACTAYVSPPVTPGVFTDSSVLVKLPVSVQRSASFSSDCRGHCVGVTVTAVTSTQLMKLVNCAIQIHDNLNVVSDFFCQSNYHSFIGNVSFP